MKKNLKLMALIAASIITVTVLTLTAFASTRQVDLTATYQDVKITLDGNELVPRDATGNIVEPFIVDGTTYLPLRAIAGALGLEVNWDGSTNTVILTTPGMATPPVAIQPPIGTVNDWLNAPGSTRVWTASGTSTIAHSTPACSGMGNPTESTKEDVVARGGRACQNCWTNIGG